jgi:Ca-activated chloride channel family protein
VTGLPLSFAWPSVLVALLVVPAGVLLYRMVTRRRPRQALIFPDLEIAAAAAARGGGFRRHLAAALFLAGLAALIAAVARPEMPLLVPSDRATVVLAIDSSGSMRSQDVLPNRLTAAQEAAKTFLRTVPPGMRVGLVAFAGHATLLVPPGTDNRDRLVEAIDGLYYIRRTAIGDGLMEAVAALPGRVRPGPDGTLPPAPPGPKPPGVVILLSDGRSNTGMDSHLAATIARQQEVMVYTVGVGQPMGLNTGWTIGGPLDEEELQWIAREAGGRYFRASSAEGLREVYRRLARTVGWEWKPQEVTSLVGALGGLMIIVAVLTSRLLTHPLRV